MYETADEHDVDLMSVDQLRERRPDLVDAIANEAKTLAFKEARKMSDTEDRVKELEGQNATLTTERNTAQEALEEAEKKEARAEAKSTIDKAISEAELPDASKKRLTERFADAENSDEIEEAVKAEIAYVAELSESGKVKGFGPSKTGDGPSAEALKESAKRFLGEGNKVQFTMLFRGRERFNKEFAINIFDNILKELGESIKIERGASMEGRRMTMIVGPVRTK